MTLEIMQTKEELLFCCREVRNTKFCDNCGKTKEEMIPLTEELLKEGLTPYTHIGVLAVCNWTSFFSCPIHGRIETSHCGDCENKGKKRLSDTPSFIGFVQTEDVAPNAYLLEGHGLFVTGVAETLNFLDGENWGYRLLKHEDECGVEYSLQPK